ncbi:hypothetical protein ACFQ1E_17240 [Sphingomonas canadensis]|uniref:Uncharacterized protein n=1 Tax=Sphingomonas canadensis TaxID=1219257 RepID=A0ABW3H9E3_9SPHN|nr:hypothetical protein [Sphingomonas canadensis]MCW3837792.1 hypothetical protein [Sphingomonas canadensis]
MVTWLQISQVLILLMAIAATGYGVLVFLAGANASSPAVSDKLGREGCTITIAGLAFAAAAIGALAGWW